MYQQFQNPIASAAKWMFFGFVGIVMMAILLGADIKDATWFNPNIAAAEANRINIESAHQQATYELEERLSGAQTEAEIQQIQRDQKMLDAQYEHDMQILTQDIANRQRWADVTITTVVFVVGVASLVAVISSFILVVAKALAILRTAPKASQVAASSRTVPEMQIIRTEPERQPYEPLEVPQQSMQQQLYDRRIAERYQEITQQKEASILGARMKAVMDPARISTENYNKLPLAGD